MSCRFLRWRESKDVEEFIKSMGFHITKDMKTGFTHYETTDGVEILRPDKPKYFYEKFIQKSCFDQQDLLDRLEKALEGKTSRDLPNAIKAFIRSELEEIEKTKTELGVKNCN